MGREPRLADVLRLVVGGGLAVLTGCASPISNLPFTEEATFLAALPTEAAWRSPELLRAQLVGDDEVLRATLSAASTWDGFVEGPGVLGNALRSREADERTDVARRWRRREVNANYLGPSLVSPEPRRIWVEAEVVRLEDGSFRSVIAAAADAEGALVEVGTGVTDDGETTAEWDLDALFEVFGVNDRPGALTVRHFEVPGDPVVRQVDGAADGAEWSIAGPDTMAFAAPLAVTADGATYPCRIEVVLVADSGGRAEGTALRGAEELAFTACWNGEGRTTYRGGDDVDDAGERGACP